MKQLRKSVTELSTREDSTGELYRSLFQASHSVMLIIAPETGDIIAANPSACSYYQHEYDNITRMRITDINMLPPEQVQREMQNAKLERRNHFHFQHQLANGDVRDVEVYSSPIVLAGEKVLYSIIHDITERLRMERERESAIAQLMEAQGEIKLLRGILPLCSFCKSIRDSDGHWESVDVYIDRHSEANISHSICPDCARKHYPQFC